MRSCDAIPALSGLTCFPLSTLPCSPNEDFLESSFFSQFAELPSPSEVRQQAYTQEPTGKSPDRKKKLVGPNYIYAPPVLFESLGLFVKWGCNISVTEGQCLFALNQLNGAVPVPKLYGWRTENGHVYFYMELLPGLTLENAWNTMKQQDRIAVCDDLRTICINLRLLEQNPMNQFIGAINRSNLYDRALEKYICEAGPFPSVKSFHKWFTFLLRRPMPDPYSVNFDAIQRQLPDDAMIKFTHNDLHPSNIIVDLTASAIRISGIVDWEQSGWLPEYWEERKALFTPFSPEDWATTYVPKFLESYRSTDEAWRFFTDAII